MDILNALKTVLYEEYGIASREELNEALKSLPAIDIAIFCSAKRKEIGVERFINTGATGTGILGREAPVCAERN